MTAVSKSQDPDKTRKKIVAGAKKIFIAKGYSGTSMRDIAKEAGLCQSLIYHHFKDKKELWLSIRDLCLEDYSRQLIDQIKHIEKGQVKANLFDILGARFEFLKEKPGIVRMFMWQCLENWEETPFSTCNNMTEALVDMIRDAQKAGEIDKNFDPAFITMFLLFLTRSWYQGITDWFLEHSNQPDASKEAQRLAYFEAIKRLLDKGIF